MINMNLENVWVNFNIDSSKDRKNTYASRYFLNNKKVEIAALKNINLDLKEDDKIALIGENGAGKSTLLRVMADILPPTEGNISSLGEKLVLMKGSQSLIHQATVLQNIKLEGFRLGLKSNQLEFYMQSVKKLIKMDDFIYSPVETLSAGMKSRLRLAIGSMRPETPDIIIMDEWIGVMDENIFSTDSSMMQLINNSKIFILASHRKQLLEKFCNKGIYIERGEIKDILPLSKIINR